MAIITIDVTNLKESVKKQIFKKFFLKEGFTGFSRNTNSSEHYVFYFRGSSTNAEF
ncbi:MAG: hypothetical protein NWE93_08600 [Candidatus Bathyarchaeota archaeon]|nr:hypothetical protein [Candidatus Bathyarchaeota archaeon]